MNEPVFFPNELKVETFCDIPLANYSTFRLGGPCRQLVECRMPEQLGGVVKILAEKQLEFFLLGGGSNLLISDEGLDDIVVRYVNPALSVNRTGSQLSVSAASSLDALAEYTVEQGLGGLLCCSGIPGTVGGAIVGNAGAWGMQIGDVLSSVRLMNRAGIIREIGPESLGFGYRCSNLQQSREIVVSAEFSLVPGDRDELVGERRRILRTRAEKHPNLQKEPCIGSIFRNIEPTSSAGRRQAAGGFLEDAGAKSLKVGGARVFEKHANIVIHTEGCTAADVHELIERMAISVKEKFEIDLVREVRFLGRFEGHARGFH